MNLLLTVFSEVRVMDIVDILLVAFLFYKLYQVVNYTRAVQLIKGLVLFFIILKLSEFAQLRMINYFLVNFISFGALALIVIFQPELRRALEFIGRNKFVKISLFNSMYEKEHDETIKAVVSATENLASTKTGALLVLVGETGLKDIVETGTSIHASISASLIENIFVPNTPLHDGALIIHDDKIVAAGCLLPLSSDRNLGRELGTRHRAALGISSISDAFVVVVSEETGIISVAHNNSLQRHLTASKLEEMLRDFYSAEGLI